jgi:hypothetical protein
MVNIVSVNIKINWLTAIDLGQRFDVQGDEESCSEYREEHQYHKQPNRQTTGFREHVEESS